MKYLNNVPISLNRSSELGKTGLTRVIVRSKLTRGKELFSTQCGIQFTRICSINKTVALNFPIMVFQTVVMSLFYCYCSIFLAMYARDS